jgi:hypothetical protein
MQALRVDQGGAGITYNMHRISSKPNNTTTSCIVAIVAIVVSRVYVVAGWNIWHGYTL